MTVCREERRRSKRRLGRVARMRNWCCVVKEGKVRCATKGKNPFWRAVGGAGGASSVPLVTPTYNERRVGTARVAARWMP